MVRRRAGAAGRAERRTDAVGGGAVRGFVEYGVQGRAESGGRHPAEADPDSRTGAGDLGGHDGLVVADRGDDEGDAVPEGLADRVVPGVTDDRVDPFEKRELGDGREDQQILVLSVGRAQGPARIGNHRLDTVGSGS